MKRILFITGFISLVSQIVLLRELNAAYYGIELIYTIGIAFWLIGTAAGASLNKKGFIPTIGHLRFIFFLCSILVPSDIFFIRGIRTLAGGTPGAYLPFDIQLLYLSAALIPISILSGLAFQWSAKLFVLSGRNLSKAYSIESAGGIAGGLLVTLFSLAGISNLQAGLLCSVSVLGIYDLSKRAGYKAFFQAAQILISCFVLILLFNTSKIDLYSESWNNPNIISTFDTPYSRITIGFYKGQYSIFEDNVLSYETESSGAEELSHIAMLSKENPREVLLLGGGFRGLPREILKYKNCNLNYVEYNRKMVELLNPLLYLDLRDSIASYRMKINFSDPRKFLFNSGKYDVIITSLPEPASGQTNRYYTKEFFKLCSSKLNKNGVLAFSLRSEENLWSPVLRKRNASVYQTLISVFHSVIVLPGNYNIYLASDSLAEFNYQTLGRRYANSGIGTKLISPRYIQYLLQNDRYESIRNGLSTDQAEINSDDKPVCYQYSIAIWLSKFYSEAANYKFSRPDSFQSTVMLLLLIVFLIFIRRFKQIKKYILILVISLQGMVLEIALLIKYQTTDGILFQNLGFLLTSFMAGLSLGSFFIENIMKNGKLGKIIVPCLVIIFALLNLLAAFSINNELFSGAVLISFFIFADGFLVSAVFAVLSGITLKEQSATISPLYTSDVVGGSIGALISGLFLIPMLGISGTLFIGALLIIILLIISV